MSHLALRVARVERGSFELDQTVVDDVDQDVVYTISRLLRAVASRQAPREETWDDPRFWNPEASRRDRCQFLAVGNALNFRFWRLHDGEVVPVGGLIEGEYFRGSMYLWRRLRLACLRHEFEITADALADMDEGAFWRAFHDDSGDNPLAVGMSDRIDNLRDLGDNLRNEWDGWFEGLVDTCCGSLKKFASLSNSLRAYDDPVQKLTMLNAIMLQGGSLITFDRSPLPAIDYHLVKQAVRQGLVKPDPATRLKLLQGTLLTPTESNRLRQATLSALVLVADRAAIPTPIIDNIYWFNRRTCANKNPDCASCLFDEGCAKKVEIGLPLEQTRYY